jgi:hypothetical protein
MQEVLRPCRWRAMVSQNPHNIEMICTFAGVPLIASYLTCEECKNETANTCDQCQYCHVFTKPLSLQGDTWIGVCVEDLAQLMLLVEANHHCTKFAPNEAPDAHEEKPGTSNGPKMPWQKERP